VEIKNPGSFITIFPELKINSETGNGLSLVPVLRFNKVEDTKIETDPTKIQKVIYCADKT
jgi:hypothetical protein